MRDVQVLKHLLGDTFKNRCSHLTALMEPHR